jgi:hypothetical protein
MRSPIMRWFSACFNPRPSSLTGDTQMLEYADTVREFQSTPVIADGRHANAADSQSAWLVSIHARHR